MKAFANSQFGYCPLISMFHDRTLNKRINRIHERALRIVYRNKTSNFTGLLQKKKDAGTYTRKIYRL